MRKRTTAQSLVEMALLLPLLLIVVFGIIDLSWYMFGYATMYQTARDASYKASLFPPKPERVKPIASTIDRNEECVKNILAAARPDGTPFGNVMTNAGAFEIRYPWVTSNMTAAQYNAQRYIGAPIEIQINYTFQPLTPLFQMIPTFRKGWAISITTRRTIESLGDNPSATNGSVCQ